MEAGTFDILIPSRYISFTLPVHSISCPTNYFYTNDIQISVLDSPLALPNNPSRVAVMLVPQNRENDWIFNTEAGHLQLLFSSPEISRLILIGNAQSNDNNVGKLYKKSDEMNPCCGDKLERSLYPLLMILLPKGIEKDGNFEVPFLSYDENVISSVIIEKCTGSYVGDMLVEDVEIEGCSREFRRRLRFKRMPNLVQTEICIVPSGVDGEGLGGLSIEKVEFCPELGKLVHPYLGPMVSGLGLVGGYLQELYEFGVRPRGFCIGVGGGALLSFLSVQLGFEVVGVEVDEEVLRIAKQYFGLKSCESIQLHVGDGIEILKKTDCLDGAVKSEIGTGLDCHHKDGFHVLRSKFDVIMVDLDSIDSRMGVSAPSLDFLHKDVLLAAKSALSEHGILVLNVIPLSRTFYDLAVHALHETFMDLHEIDCKNAENFVLIASKTSMAFNSSALENTFLNRLKSVISVSLDAIRKL